MSISINTNVSAFKAVANLSKTSKVQEQAIERLSSGLRINSAKDDAAGLAIASRMEKQMRAMVVSTRNVNDGISLSQTAEGFTEAISDNLQRMRELGVQAKNGSLSSDDRLLLNKEFQQLVNEVKRSVDSAEFNGIKLLDGSNTTFAIQVGTGNSANDVINIESDDLSDLDSYSSALDLTSVANSTAAITALDSDIDTVNSLRSTLGASQARFESIVSTLSTSISNLNASRGRILDADFAQETTNLAKASILQNAGLAVLAQANQQPQTVLRLLV